MLEQAPYDAVAAKWADARSKGGFREKSYVDRFLEYLPAGGCVLDLGCGSGVPIARYLLDHGYRVTGVDSSGEMLRLFRANCPEAEAIRADMVCGTFLRRIDGLIAWDSVFHIPKLEHAVLFRQMRLWVTPGAPVLLSAGGTEDEFTAPMFDVPFFYSGHAPEQTKALLRDAGFEILCAEIDDPSSRGHLAVLCRAS